MFTKAIYLFKTIIKILANFQACMKALKNNDYVSKSCQYWSNILYIYFF